MSSKVDLSEIVDAFENQGDSMRSFVERKTGEVLMISEEALSWAERQDEEGERREDEGDWWSEEVERARRVLSSDDHLELPSQWDLHEYEILRTFVLGRASEHERDQLGRAIQGRGAFRRFKDVAAALEVLDEWFAYRRREFRETARAWCEENELAFDDGEEEN